jgi:hypothetical protein
VEKKESHSFSAASRGLQLGKEEATTIKAESRTLNLWNGHHTGNKKERKRNEINQAHTSRIVP